MTDLVRRLRIGGGLTMLARIGTVVLNLGALAILSRELDSSSFGSYVLAVTIVYFGSVVSAMGLENTLIRGVALALEDGDAGRARASARAARRLALLSGSVMVVAYLGVSERFVGGVLANPVLASHGPTIVLWFLLQTFNQLGVATTRGRHRLEAAAVFDGFTKSLVLLVSVTILVQSGPMTLDMALLAGTLATGVSAILVSALEFGWERSLAVSPLARPAKVSLLARESWPILGSTVVGFVVTQGDLWLVSALSRESGDVGVYGAATRLLLLVTVPVAALHGTIASTIAELFQRSDRERLQRVLRIAATIAGLPSIILVGCFAAFGDVVLASIFGASYASGWLVLGILGAGRLAQVVTGSCGLALMMTGHQKAQLVITSGNAIILAAGAYLMGSRYGLIGVAGSYATGLWLTNLMTMLYARSRLGVWTFMYLSFGEIISAIRIAARRGSRIRPGGTHG